MNKNENDDNVEQDDNVEDASYLYNTIGSNRKNLVVVPQSNMIRIPKKPIEV